MKKLVTLLLVLAMLLSLGACGGDVPTNTEDGTKPSQSENTKPNDSDHTDPSEEESTEPNDSDDPEPSQNEATDNGGDAENNEITFTETVVVDNDECLIKITDIDPDNLWGFTLKVMLENKSADKTYMFSVDSAAVNGVQSDPLFAAEVAAGKRSNEEISFAGDELEKNGVGAYTDIELTFRVYDSDDWSADDVVVETVHIYPYGEDKAVQFIREEQPSDNVIIDNEYATVIVTGYEYDDIWGYTVNLYLVNKTDKNVMFSVEDASVNGFMLDPFYAESVSAGKCAFGSMSWYDSDFEDNDITEVEEIEFTLSVSDYDDWLADDFVNEVITLNP